MTKWLGKLVGKVVDMALQASLLAQGSVRGENGIPRLNNRVIKYWNQLPLRVRNSTSINAFKAGLDLFKLSKPDSPNGFW